MKEMRRVLALILCFVMLVGVVPVGALAAEAETTVPSETLETQATEATAAAMETTEAAEIETSVPETTSAAEVTEAALEETTEAAEEEETEISIGWVSTRAADAETVLDAAIFCSDVHGSSSDLSSVLGGVAKSGVDYSLIGFDGDTCLTVANTTNTVQSALDDTDIKVVFSYAASHDTENSADISTNWNYSGVAFENDYYYVYTIRETDMQNSSSAATAAPAFAEWVSTADTTKPVFIISHRPLHERRNDNAGAAAWYTAISAAAEKMDIVFFWAHNHTGETSVDTNAYYVEKNGTETITVEGGSTVAPNFTYMNAGYINANNQNPARIGVATTVQITADSLIFQDYNSSGAYSGTYAHNVTVAREFAASEPEVTLSSIAVTTPPTKTIYDVGEELDTNGMIVTATYSDGSTAEVTGWYTSSVDMNTTGEKTVTVNLYDNGITYKATFTITVEEQVSADATLTKIEIVSEPTKTEYLLSQPLDITGMAVEATFSDGTVKELSYGGFADTEVSAAAIDTYYYIENFSMYVEKAHEAVVTYTYGDVTCTDTFTINVWAEDFADETTGVKVHVSGDYGVTMANVAESANENVASAIAQVISGTNYKAYDITLTFDEGYEATDAAKTVTLPIPAGVTNPVVYYVSDDGATVTNMKATKGNGVVTFETTHFSTYVVGESTEITVPDPTTQTVTGATTTEPKTVYVLVSTPTAGKQYIIVSGNSAGSAYALKENTTTGSSITINAAGNGISAPWIETSDKTIMWNAASGMTFQSENGSYYLRQQNSNGSRSLTFSTSQSTDWTVGTNTLSYVGKNNTYYVSGGSTWSLSTNSANVYFYEKQTVTVTTSANGTYSIAGTPAEVSKVVVNGTTTTLGSTLTFVPESGTTTTTDTSTTATYTVVENGDPNGIISDISGNTVTFTGNYGKALVKVSYTVTVNGTGYTVDNYITVTAKAPTYNIEISENGTTAANDTIAVRGVTEGKELQLSYLLTYEDSEGVNTLTPTSGITWYCYLEDGSNASGIATIDQTGKLTFTGAEGTIKVMVAYETDNVTVTDIITINVRKSNAVTPSESTTDFPRWPDEGAVRFDKTASAVGNFSETGIAQVELSMAGIPVKTGGSVDVVIMLDMTGSMSGTAMTAAEESAIAFAGQIVKNDDGTYNDSRIAILAFNSGNSSPYTYWELGTVSSDDEWNTLCTKVRGASEDQESGGTPYDDALEKCQSILADAKKDGIGDNRQQFCVFVSDGGPTSYEYITNYDAVKAGTATVYTTSTASATGGSSQPDSNFATIAGYTHEYYSTLMKDAGVTMYSVLTGLSAANYPNCTTILQNIATDSSKAYVVENGSDTSAITDAFTAIAEEINAAATNVNVEDVITDEYDLIFELPNSNITGLPSGQEFYIEVVDYPLDESTHERNGTSKILQRIYLATDTDGKVYISKITHTNDEGIVVEQTITPVFTAREKGTDKAYFTWTDSDNDGVADAGEYTYNPDGDGTHHMTSGAYVVLNDDGSLKSLHTMAFTYVVADKKLNWTVTSMSQTSETALRYFVYLKGSGGVAAEDQIAAGTYPTNKYATLNYTNHLGNECEQTFPVPQMTWNGAQVSYVFYLVNENGVPVNRAGREITFAEAIFVTDIYTHAIVWNDLEQSAGLEASYLAQNLLPSSYSLYDPSATYKIHVYENEAGVNLNNHFVIGGTDGDTTTYVYNNKTDVNKYNVHGTYAATSTYLCKSYSVTATVENGVITAAAYTKVDGETQVAWNDLNSTTGATNIDGYAYYVDENGDVYTIVQKTNGTAISGFDFANTTVAFAVVWEKKLTDDTVVVDYGLPVDIDVVSNDFVYNYVTGIGATDPDYGINTGYKTDTASLTATNLTIDGHSVKIHDENHIRFTPGSGSSMEFNAPVEFYYETTVEVYENSHVVPSYMYAKVTVIPATTVYYEENFVTFTNSGSTDGTYGAWTDVGTTISNTQDQDRPGASQISGALDADNDYGYDSAYDEMGTYSMGSAKKAVVSSGKSAMASFDFYGTGFDVISMTTSATGTIIVNVYDEDNVMVKSHVVDTYYGMLADGTLSPNAPDALYQVPVMKITGLAYGKYTAKIVASYQDAFDHNENGSYEFYLDSIRIYDPTGVASGSVTNDTVQNAYKADNEAWPVYEELRNYILDAGTFNSSSNVVEGAVFIDSNNGTKVIADYKTYGPNNEVYLANGQAVVFELNLGSSYIKSGEVADVQLGIKSATGSEDGVTVNLEMTKYEKNSEGKFDTSSSTAQIKTTTDRYYSIGSHVNKSGTTILSFKNVGSGIISITNVKVTFESEPTFVSDTSDSGASAAMASVASVASAAALTETEVRPASLFTISRSTADAVLADMNYVEEEKPEITVPEETEPEAAEPETTDPEETEPEATEREEILDADLQVSIRNHSVKVGSTIVVMATTSADVDALTVNGREVTKYVESRLTGKRTWTTTVKATEAGDLDIEVTAFGAEGEALETVTETVVVTGNNAGIVQQIIGHIIGMLFR